MESRHGQSAKTQRFTIDSDPAPIHCAIVQDGVTVIERFISPELVQKPNRGLRRTPGCRSHVFRHEMLHHELRHKVCRLTFEESGDYWLGYSAVLENGPGAPEQQWHRDQPSYPLVKQGSNAPQGMLNFFTALTDFDAETGRTQYIWGSNKLDELGTPDADHPIESMSGSRPETPPLSAARSPIAAVPIFPTSSAVPCSS
ncbi:hypothetical protein E4U43_002332 [Claviceps pusilla]|uniref:Uncharacterized protein n=1 Tax=Claviceps pusilla TaxID=123648 RepID=A0A9P7SVC0_9HYPO|nr:hypothetical protein E4U43_002332 [Claviceps pusilla]